MLGYKILLGVVTVFIIFGYRAIISTPPPINRGTGRVFCVILFLCYLFPWLETATNYPKNSAVYIAASPLYNVIPLLFLLMLGAGLIPSKKVFSILSLTVFSVTPLILFHLYAYLSDYAKTAVLFSERNGLYALGQAGLCLFSFLTVCSDENRLRVWERIVAGIPIPAVYGLAALWNAKTGGNVFGLSLGEDGYFLLPSLCQAEPKTLFALNFILPVICICLFSTVSFFLKKKSAR